MLASVAYICGGTQYQFECVSSQQVPFNACLLIFHACSFHDKVHDTCITRYEEAWSTQACNGNALWISHGTTCGRMCNSEVVIEWYHKALLNIYLSVFLVWLLHVRPIGSLFIPSLGL